MENWLNKRLPSLPGIQEDKMTMNEDKIRKEILDCLNGSREDGASKCWAIYLFDDDLH